MKDHAKNPTPLPQPYTYASIRDRHILITAARIYGTLTSIYNKSTTPAWFKRMVDEGVIYDDLGGRIYLLGETTAEQLEVGSYVYYMLNSRMKPNSISEGAFKTNYRRHPVKGDWVFSLYNGHSYPEIEQVYKVFQPDNQVFVERGAFSTKLQYGWRFAEDEEVMAQAHKNSIAYNKFWNITTAPKSPEALNIPPKDLMLQIATAQQERDNFQHFIKQMTY